MKFNILFVITIFIFIPHIKTSEYFTEPLEQFVIKTFVYNCTDAKRITGTDYDTLKRYAKYEIPLMTFIHFTKKKRLRYQFNNVYKNITTSKYFNKSNPTAIIMYGFFGKLLPIQYESIAEALVEAGNVNVFVIDYLHFVSGLYYACATYTQIVGEALGKLLAKLYNNGYGNFHLIGHSLGAHTAGFAGKTFEKLTSTKLRRISGMDPAGPCFFNEPPEKRLTNTDADFVDVIHTNTVEYGIPDKIGHVDFFPNGGKHQPSCFILACSHIIVGIYYAESIKYNQFTSVECTDWETFSNGGCANNKSAKMGYWTETNTRGTHFLKTYTIPIFAKGDNGIKSQEL